MKWSLFALFPAFVLPSFGDITLPPLVSDNLLLQRSHAAVWGKADPGEKIAIRFGGAEAKVTADAIGRWRVILDGLQPGLKGTMTVSGKNTLNIRNVAVGDVWVCSGQSNMEMMVGPLTTGAWRGYKGVVHFEKEIADAQFPQIRLFHVVKRTSETPVEEVEGKWEVCTPETVKDWSAVGYFFARQLHQDVGVPVGLIHASWGGTFGQCWTPSETVQSDPDLKKAYYTPWLADVAKYPAVKERYEKETLPAWKIVADAARKAGKRGPLKPEPPLDPRTNVGMHAPAPGPGLLYNAMISGATKYPIKGAIWYQGESNVWEPIVAYDRLIPTMVAAWRKAWDQGEFPFYIVQLANWKSRRPEPADSKFAAFRDVQRQIASIISHSGLAVCIDVGDETDIHFPNKQEVGRRLALLAEARTYGKSIVGSGPFFVAARFNNATVTISFQPGTATVIASKDGGPVKGFAIAGEDRKFVWADAQIVNGASNEKEREPVIVLKAPQIAKPIAVRYAWANNPEVNLVNSAGLPAVPFRTDEWPQKEPPAITPAATPGPK